MRRALILCCLLLSACGAVRELREKAAIAETATIRLFARIDEVDAEGLHRMFSPKLREKHNVQDVRKIFGKIHDESGRCDTPKTATWKVNITVGGTFVILTSTAKCREKDLSAQLQWRLTGEQATLEAFAFASQLGNSSE